MVDSRWAMTNTVRPLTSRCTACECVCVLYAWARHNGVIRLIDESLIDSLGGGS